MNEYGALMEWCWERKTEVLREKSISMPLCQPQIPNWLA